MKGGRKAGAALGGRLTGLCMLACRVAGRGGAATREGAGAAAASPRARAAGAAARGARDERGPRRGAGAAQHRGRGGPRAAVLSAVRPTHPRPAPQPRPNQSQSPSPSLPRAPAPPAQVGSPAHADPAGGSEGSPRRQRGGTAASWERRLAPRPNPMAPIGPPSGLPKGPGRAHPTRAGGGCWLRRRPRARRAVRLETISRRSRDCAASHRDTAALGLQARSEMLLLRRALLGHTGSAPTAPSSRRGSQARRG